VPKNRGGRMLDVNDLLTYRTAGQLIDVSGSAIRAMVLRGCLRNEVIAGFPFVSRQEVLHIRVHSNTLVSRMNKEQLLADVRRVADSLGRLPNSPEYVRLGRFNFTTLLRRFGSWRKVCEATRKEQSRLRGMRAPAIYFDATLAPSSKESKKRPRLLDVSDLITKKEAGPLRGVSAMAIHQMVRLDRLQSEVICGKPFVFRGEVLALKVHRREQVRRMSNDEVLQAVVAVGRRLGHPPTSSEYQTHGEISLGTLWKRFGSWDNVLNAIQRAQAKLKAKP
jgi:Homing endonuclease associated repeat